MALENKQKNGKMIKHIIILIIILITVLNIIQVTIVAEITKSKLESDAIQKYTLLTKQTEMVNQNLIESYLAHMDFYAKADITQTGDTEAIVSWMKTETSKRAEMFDYIGYVDSQGNNFTDTGSTSSVADRDYFKAIMGGADTYIDNPTIARTTGAKVIHACKAVKVNGKNIGLFYGTLDPAYISKVLDRVDLGKAGHALIFGSDGSLIGSSIDDDEIILKDLEAMKIKYLDSYSLLSSTWGSKNTITENIKNGDGNAQVMISMPLEGTPWNLMFLLNKKSIFAISSLLMIMMISTVSTVAFVIVIAIGLVLYKTIRPLVTVEKTIRDIASGDADLTKRIDVKNMNNEIGRVVEGYNSFADKLQDIVKTLKDSKNDLNQAGNLLQHCTKDTSAAITDILSNITDMDQTINDQSNSVTETSGAVNQIASNIESLNRMIENQVAAVTQASASVEEMIGNINSVNSNVKKMSVQFKSLEKKVTEGVQRQTDVNDKIEEISADSQMLQEANVVISSIAEQTNLLAMNAAIEAAHAGEAGKGFSVVADEIRKLSEDATNQSQTIGTQLSKITETIESIVEASQLASNAFSEVSGGIEATNNLVQEITNAMEEQGAGSKQISSALNDMNSSSNQVKTASLEMAEGNKAILEEIKRLMDATGNMKDDMNRMNAGAGKISETGDALSSISNKMESSIQKIEEQIDKFKV